MTFRNTPVGKTDNQSRQFKPTYHERESIQQKYDFGLPVLSTRVVKPAELVAKYGQPHGINRSLKVYLLK